MPVPLLALALAAGGGMTTGFLIDHLVGDGEYSAEEAVLDASLGMVGGSLLRPTLRIGSRLKNSVRISRGRPSTFERVAYRAQTGKPVFSNRRDAAMWAMYRTGTQSGPDARRVGKFYGVSGAHSYYLASRSRGSGAPTGQTSTRTARPDTRGAREFMRRKGSSAGSVAPRTSSGRRKPVSRRKNTIHRPRRPRCPPGHYWSKRYQKCIRYRNRS